MRFSTLQTAQRPVCTHPGFVESRSTGRFVDGALPVAAGDDAGAAGGGESDDLSHATAKTQMHSARQLDVIGMENQTCFAAPSKNRIVRCIPY
jgi:hypothetical protein